MPCNLLYLVYQADVAESLAQARQMGTLAKQHAALAAQRVTAVRLGEAAQALGTAPGSRGGPGIEAGKPAGNATATTRCAASSDVC
jgi:hypothetical protein